ncbi:hypothetical protein GH811_00015 [Acetobacterium malicum]|uniref:Phage abortive infection protein n=1 Tax=Acetobacterium malicum TaxID=52692 RepID=A0ABR6YSA1_9FIRM|nr:hypothetical protein [Acetobacterium malicum]MBC3897996.1 hypothetical protein [Acetobacterium malicum]
MNKFLKLLATHKVITGIVIGICFGIVGPIVINQLYKYGNTYGGYLTLWEATDLLQYYGTLLGATATIIAVIWTINFTRESAEKDRRLSENNSYKNYGIQICLDLLDSCSNKRIIENINNATKLLIEDSEKINKMSYNNSVNKEIDYLKRSITEAFIKFDNFHLNLPKSKEKKVWEYVKYFCEFLNELEEKHLIQEDDEKANKINIGDVNRFFETYMEKYLGFQEYMHEIIFSYDYTVKKITDK